MLSAELAIAKNSRRGAARTDMDFAGTFVVDQSSRCICRIADLSMTGARLELFNEIEKGSDIELRLPGAVVRRARVVWVRNLEAGCVFDELLGEDMIDALAEAHGFSDRRDPFLSHTGRA